MRTLATCGEDWDIMSLKEKRMDPDETLRMARDAAKRLRRLLDSGDEPETAADALDEASDLLDAFEALDGWMGTEGFLPKSWARGREIKPKPKTPRELAEADDVGQFEFEHAGMRCFVRRFNKRSNWCGYVLLPDGHPWREAGDLVSASVYGGVTWNRESPGHLEGVEGWLVGFDTSHCGDFIAVIQDDIGGIPDDIGGIWRDRKYVEAECRSLAEQAAEATKIKEEE